ACEGTATKKNLEQPMFLNASRPDIGVLVASYFDVDIDFGEVEGEDAHTCDKTRDLRFRAHGLRRRPRSASTTSSTRCAASARPSRRAWAAMVRSRSGSASRR